MSIDHRVQYELWQYSYMSIELPDQLSHNVQLTGSPCVRATVTAREAYAPYRAAAHYALAHSEDVDERSPSSRTGDGMSGPASKSLCVASI